MKKTVLLLLPALCCYATLCAQNPDYRFGKVSENELRMESYDKDPDADAVILYENNNLYYQLGSNGFMRTTDYFVRIKVLKPEGTDVANVNLYYFDSSSRRDNITGLDGVAYNLQDGKIVKSELKKQYIFKEEYDAKTKRLKFSIPEVKAGTVIEYRYRHTSDNVTDIPTFYFQHNIPVAVSSMQASIPEFFQFKIEMTGYHKLDFKETAENSGIPGGANYTNRIFKTEAKDIPALKKEPYVWFLDDFRSTLRFELAHIVFPLRPVQSFISSWKEVNEALAETTFNDHTKIGNPFKDEVEAIKNTEQPRLEKARAVLRLVQSKMKWDDTYRLFSTNPRAAATKGAGTSADINFVLMAALKDAGFPVVPILLSPRHMGRLSYTHPTIDGIRAFVLRIQLDEGTYAYADGTNPNSDINLLPTELLVDRARVYRVDGTDGWCDLSTLSPSTYNSTVLLDLSTDDIVSGKVIEQQANQSALRVSTRYTESKSQDEFIEGIEKEQEIQIEDFQIKGVGTPLVSQEYKMTLSTVNATDEFVYLNATVLPFMSKSPFESQTRVFPIEFPEITTYTIRGSVGIPEGYTVEELPKSIGIVACEDGLKCKYQAVLAGRYVQFSFQFTVNRLIYSQLEYEDIKTFFGRVIDLNNNQIVLRKIANQ